MAPQGSPPGRFSGQPDLGRHGYDPAPPDQAGGTELQAGAELPARTESPPRAELPTRSNRAPRFERPRWTERHDRAGRADRGDRHGGQRQPGWRGQVDAFGSDTDVDLPPWAGPSVYPTRPGATRLRPRTAADDSSEGEQADRADLWEGEERPEWPENEQGSADAPSAPRPGRRIGRRAAATRLRKSKRRIYRYCGLAIAVCVIAAGVALIVTHHPAKKLPYVTSLLPGEFKSVPNSCSAVSPALLNRALPTAGRTTVAVGNSSTDSQCSFTVDRRPNLVVLQVGAQSYQPFAAASGNGSASDNALDQFVVARYTLGHPPKKSPLPPATISPLTGLGKQAFMAVALEHVGHISTDVVTVAILDHNVIITIEMQGQESGDGFGPVSLPTLEANAKALATNMLAKVRTQPTA